MIDIYGWIDLFRGQPPQIEAERPEAEVEAPAQGSADVVAANVDAVVAAVIANAPAKQEENPLPQVQPGIQIPQGAAQDDVVGNPAAGQGAEQPQAAEGASLPPAGNISPQNAQGPAPEEIEILTPNGLFKTNFISFFNIFKAHPFFEGKTDLEINKVSDNESTFTIKFPHKLTGVVKLITDARGKTHGYIDANGAKVFIEKELKGSINYQTGKITFEGKGLTVFAMKMSHSVHEVTMMPDGTFVFKRSGLLPLTLTFDIGTMLDTLSAVIWTDPNAKPLLKNPLKWQVRLKAGDIWGAIKKRIFKTVASPNTLSERQLLERLAEGNLTLLNIGRKKKDAKGLVRLLAESKSDLSLERKMIRGAETLAEFKFDDVQGIDIETARENLQSLRAQMYTEAATIKGQDRIWEAMTRAIENLDRERLPSLASRVLTYGACLLGDYVVGPAISTVSSVAKAAWAHRWKIAAAAIGAASVMLK